MRSQISRLTCSFALVSSAWAGALQAQPVGRDFNGDGVLDYLASVTGYDTNSPQNGAVRVWSGASKNALHTIVSPHQNTLFGFSVESAGDINSDGFDDFVIGEPLWGTPHKWEGRIHLISGADGSTLRIIEGPSPENGLGRYATGVGDWNGDGTPDIASSAWIVFDDDGDGHSDSATGVVYIFSGANGMVLAEIADAQATSYFGFGVFGLGDVNGDGLADIAITDPRAPGAPGSGATGQYHVFTGRTGMWVSLEFADAAHSVVNADPDIRTFAAQIDTMHPNRWMSEATLQVLSLTTTDAEGNVNNTEFDAKIVGLSGVVQGGKGIKPSLLEKGDIDMNGEVNGDDLIASAGQFGTSPNALGVMPVADVNKDGLVDESDIGQVLASFGATSNIFEDLWRDDRLRSIGGGAAGFGSMPGGGNFAPSGPFTPRPIDDCNLLVAGPQTTTSYLPQLLSRDLATNCQRCPDCETVGTVDCYECNTLGELTGGEIDIDNPQPSPGQTVTFTVEPIVLDGGFDRCKTGCGGDPNGDGNDCAHYDGEALINSASWVIEKLNATTGEWDIIKRSQNGDSPTVQGQACEEFRLRRLEFTVHAPTEDTGACTDISLPEEMLEVQFATFTLDWECFAATPSNRHRSLLGIGEEVRVWVVEANAGTPTWSAPEGKGFYDERQGIGHVYSARSDAGQGQIVAEINGCRRKLNFRVIEPTKVNYQQCDSSPSHTEGMMNAWGYLKLDLDPDTVSFYNVATIELEAQPENVVGSYATPVEEGGIEPHTHPFGQEWIYTREDNTQIGSELLWTSISPVTTYEDGSFDWNIAVNFAVSGPNGIVKTFPDSILQTFRVFDGTCVSVSKGGYTPSFCVSDPDAQPVTPCPLNGW